MGRYRIRVVGGSCGQALIRITERLREWINEELGYPCRVDYQNIWESFYDVPDVEFILQTMPAFSPTDTRIPIVGVKRLILDVDHRPTLRRILDQLQGDLGDPPRGVPAWVVNHATADVKSAQGQA